METQFLTHDSCHIMQWEMLLNVFCLYEHMIQHMVFKPHVQML